ncbi:hypothetical protein GEMRC1_001405 [Eukaryota sp. GEM-RC1]
MVSFFADEDIFIYIDDIIVCSEDFSDLLAKLRKILSKARDKRVRFGLRKCDFITFKSKIEILGCIFQNFQRSISPDRIKAICSLLRPKTLSEVRSFVGSINFIRDWIPNLASVLEPISNLLRKTNKIIWTAETETCFKEILKLISSNIPLNLPDAKATILISTDASEVGLSGIIWEQIEDCADGTPLIERKTRPLCFYSKKFTDSQKNWPTIQKELYAILATLTLSPLSSFLLTKRFTLFCDHKNLSYLISAPEKNRIVTRWIPILANFEFELVHTAGEDNHFADLLSRCFPEPSSVNPSILMCSSTVPDAVEGRHLMAEDSRLSSPQTSHQPSGPVSNRASGATFQTSTQMMRQFDKDCEGLSREEQVQLFWDRKDAFMEAHEQEQEYINALEAEIKESTDEQLRLQLERDAAVALIEDDIEDQEFHDHLRGNGLFIDEDGHMCQLPSIDSDDEFRIYMTDIPDHIDLSSSDESPILIVDDEHSPMLEDLPSIEAIGASYRLFPHLIRDTSEFLRISNSAATSAVISVSSEDEDDLYEQFLGESPKDTRLFDNLGNELPGPWNPPTNININPRPNIPLAPPNFDHVGIHDNAGYYSPCTDSALTDEGPFDIMIATLDDSRAIEPEIDEDNLFAERLTIDPLSHNPLSSSDSDLPEETSWTQIPDPSHVFNDWLKLLSQEQEQATKDNDITMTTDTELISVTANDKDYVLTWNHRKKKFVIPDSLKRHLLLTIHGSTRAGHPSKKDSVSALMRSDYWWPNYLYDMKSHVKNCIPCQKTAPAPELKLPSSGNLWSDRPFQCLHADVIGPLSPDSEDYKYILVFVCSFSRFSILVPLKVLNAQEVAYSILWNVVGNYGIPSQILSDNGPEFANAVNKSLCLFLNIEKKFSTPYFHQSNGLVERRHREVLQTLRRLLIDLQAHSNWSTYIPITQLILNTRTSSITNFTPFELIVGSKTDPRQLPLQVIQNCTLDDHLPQNSYVDALKQKTSTILNKWKEAENSSNLKKRSLSSRNSATNKKLIDDINQGDFVLKLSEHPSKTHGKWTGPYLVEDVSYHPSNCLVRNLITGISVRCSLYHVKKCHTNHSENVLQAYAATDSEEVVIDKIIDHDLTSPQDPKYLVRWLDGTTTWEGRSVENTAAYYAYRRKYIDEPPQARGLATARANSKLDAAWKAQHHKSAPVVARNQHRMKTRNRTSH